MKYNGEKKKAIKIALVGNPNSGKTTLFNLLTDSAAHVGNLAGVTVERLEKRYKYRDGVIITDLPGIYSLSPYSPEEKISRDYITGVYGESPDVIINIINVLNFERGLYLTTQLLETECPIIIALNMTNILEERLGISDAIDIRLIEKIFKVPAVKISALNGDGTDELIDRAVSIRDFKRKPQTVLKDSRIYNNINNIKRIFERHNISNPLFYAVKALEHDVYFLNKCDREVIKAVEFETAHADDICHSEGKDIEAAIASMRYEYICNCSLSLVKTPVSGSRTGADTAGVTNKGITNKIDNIMLHRIFALPIFFCMMFMIFHVIFSRNFLTLNVLSPGVFLKSIIEEVIRDSTPAVFNLLKNIGASDRAAGLAANGIWTGTGSVLTFVPQIMLLFLFLSMLEDSGYMARAAFIMDEPLRKFGLSGKSFVPMLMGFGCSVPAVMSTRTIENKCDRHITIMLVPFMSCGAKFPIYAMIASAIFKERSDIIIFLIYFLGIAAAAVSGIILRSFFFKGDTETFIMEMPEYRLPNMRVLIPKLWEKLKEFIVRAGTLIASSAIIVWILQNFTFKFNMTSPSSPESMIAVIGNFIRPVFIPLGFASGQDGWIPVVSVLTGFAAKEAVVSSLSQLNYAVEMLSPPAALSFMAFNLLCIPCFAAVAAIKKEINSPKLLAFTLLYQFSAAWITAFLIYSFGMFFASI